MLRRAPMALLVGLVASAAASLAACRTSLEDDPGSEVCDVATSQACMDAEQHADLAWIEANIFSKQCAFSGCHNGSTTPAGMIDLKNPGMSHAALVDVESKLEPGRKLVVAGQPKQSYLMMLLQHYPPSAMEPPLAGPPEVGFMPQDADPICCQKLDALDRWITAGALNN
ncbi:MAG: hypothetical protein H0T89_32555 [Deltaproteobacteria bacterium]|nr:hypothetical protein [Deltaproteobacteria bacterium]MDQ3299017.1 hypothetical protein [Myxococcota bacterium]